MSRSTASGLRGTLKSTISKVKEKALRPSFKNKNDQSELEQSKVRTVFTTSILLHARPVEIANVFFDPLYYENSLKARRSIVHEYVVARDIIVYLTERRNSGKVGKGKFHCPPTSYSIPILTQSTLTILNPHALSLPSRY